tara:strand:+ start:25 stop:336 length:312 start_codon:yes stop_codon:yes gene_type:complete
MAYYDTTHLRDHLSREAYKEEHRMFLLKNCRQEDAILKIAERMVDGKFSPSQMLQRLEGYGRNIPITSVRRAISDLTRNGELVKTDKQVMGIYGRKEYVWRIA